MTAGAALRIRIERVGLTREPEWNSDTGGTGGNRSNKGVGNSTPQSRYRMPALVSRPEEIRRTSQRVTLPVGVPLYPGR